MKQLKPPHIIDPDHVASRMYVLRCAMGFPGRGGQTKLAERYGVKYGFTAKIWSEWEKNGRITKEAAARLLDMLTGLTLDWIYFGAEDGLTGAVRRIIEDAERADAADRGLDRK